MCPVSLHADAEAEPENTVSQTPFGMESWAGRCGSDTTAALRQVARESHEGLELVAALPGPHGRIGALRAPGQVVKAPRVGTTFGETAPLQPDYLEVEASPKSERGIDIMNRDCKGIVFTTRHQIALLYSGWVQGS